jgi:hypothetical protein
VSIQNTGGAVLNGRIGNFDNLPIGGAAKQSETIVFSAVPSTADRQTLEANQGYYYGISLNPSSGLALDQIGVSAAAAYSLRKLRAGYTGSAIRVRRSSDNAELDIGFTASGELDINALRSFFGIGNDVARLDYNPATARTNLLTHSNDFDNATGWPISSFSIITPNSGISPDGSNNAYKLADAAGTGPHGRNAANFTFISGVTYTLSIFAKAAEKNFIQIVFPGAAFGTAAWANFDVNTGIAGTVGATATSNITPLPNGWFRLTCTATATASATGSNMGLNLIQSNTAPRAQSYSGTATEGQGVLIYGAQAETGAATAYIPTTGTTRTVSDPRGLLIEGARTNVALWARDLTQTPWVKTDMTAALTETGIDGAANSASLLTATAANATVLQTVTLASSQRTQSAFVRRVTGTGTVEMTTDNGTTWTPITLTSSLTRFDLPPQTVTNPVFGFRIVTSGDAIAVDYVQNETGPFASSPILTTTAATTRAADNAIVSVLSSIGFNPAQGTIVAEFEYMGANPGAAVVSICDSGSSNEIVIRRAAGTPADFLQIVRVGGVDVVSTITANLPSNTVHKAAIAYQLNNSQTSLNGVNQPTDTACTVPVVDRMLIGNRNGSNLQMFGWLRRVSFVPYRATNAQLQALTA